MLSFLLGASVTGFLINGAVSAYRPPVEAGMAEACRSVGAQLKELNYFKSFRCSSGLEFEESDIEKLTGGAK